MKKIIMGVMAMGAFDTAMSQSIGCQLVVNGNFMENDCPQDWCTSTSPNMVRGWIPEPDIELGWGDYMNGNLPGGQRAVELASSHNTCIEQKFTNLGPGVYQLKYQYAARGGRDFDDCQLEVSFSGKVLKRITPCDYNLNTDVIEFEVKGGGNQNGLVFCGVGGAVDNDSGAILKSVSLIKKSDLSATATGLQPIILDSHSGRCLQKQYPFESGTLEIDFDYNIISKTLVQNSAVYVTLNGQPIYKTLPCENGKTIKLVGDIPKGLYTLGFCPVGSPNQAPHQVSISSIALSVKQCVPGLTSNLLINGGFDQNSCSQTVCTWNQQNVGKQIAGWIPSPEIEIGRGNFYNSNLGNSWVAQLDANSNTCIRQNVALQSGTHTLSFDWAARPGSVLDSSTFEVKINGGKVFEGIPKDLLAHQEKIPLQLQNLPAQSSIEFCGTGKSDCMGALIGNVKLQRNDKCASYSTLRY